MASRVSLKEAGGNFINKLTGFVPFSFGFADRPTEEALYKAVIPEFLYKPPFGYPRFVDIPNIRRLAASPAASMPINTILDEFRSVKWEIAGKGDNFSQAHVDEVALFFEDPNKNKESWGMVMERAARDILEVDSGVWVKVFNIAGEMVEIYARDGGSFTQNPNIYGVLGGRAEILPPLHMLGAQTEAFQDFVTQQAAYFQYPWSSGSYITPFGHREIVYMKRRSRTDTIYGRSETEIAANILEMLLFGIDHNLSYFTENEIPKGVAQMIGANKADIDRFKLQWREMQRKKDEVGRLRKLFYNLPIINQEMKFTKFGFSNLELELLAQQKWFSKIVWSLYGATPTEMGFTEDSSRNVDFSQSRIFRKKAIVPLLSLLKFHINSEIIPEFGYDDVEFRFIHEDIETDILKYSVYQKQLTLGVRTINEVRKEEGLDDVEWGDEPFSQMGNLQQDVSGSTTSGFGSPGSAAGKDDRSEEKPPDTPPTKPLSSFKVQQPEKSPKKACAEPRKRIKAEDFGRFFSYKGLTTDSPLRLGPHEEVTENQLEKVLKVFLNKLKKDVLKELKESQSDDLLSGISSKAITESVIDRIKSIITAGSIKSIVDRAIRSSFIKGVEEASDDAGVDFVPDNGAIGFLQKHTFQNIKDMTEEIENDLRQTIERAITEGKNPRDITEDVKKIFKTNEARAQSISRTEMNRALNAGHQKSYEQMRPQGKKEWVSTLDSRTSAVCKRLDGDTVPVDSQFHDKDFNGMFPPAHVNCRSRIILSDKNKGGGS